MRLSDGAAREAGRGGRGVTAIATATAVEVLRFTPETSRAVHLYHALVPAMQRAGTDVQITREYQGRSTLLMLWGPGGLDRQTAMRRQMAAGGHVICWDLAYWDRDRKVRVSFDGPHPQGWVMRRRLPGSRLQADGVRLENRWTDGGPVLVAGIGAKARLQYGATVVDAWEQSMIDRIQRAGLKVIYRPKTAQLPRPANLPISLQPVIDQALVGLSAVVTFHSNVAVDAIRLGIPVVCRDGAASAVCAGTWPDGGPVPMPIESRRRFLENLAWFQWDVVREADDCWKFLSEALT